MRVCVIASSRFPVSEPFAGGLEAHTHLLVRGLRNRGHEVTLFAAQGSDPALGVRCLEAAQFTSSAASRRDVGAPPEAVLQEHHAYLSLMLELAQDAEERFDVIHNNSLHHLPIAMARTVGAPIVTTLHTPPLGMLESAIRLAPGSSTFVSVSAATRRAWAPHVPSTTVHNGVDTRLWRPRKERAERLAVWSGRMVPEKAPHHAIMAARAAGVRLVLAGPRWDDDYFDVEVRPRLGGDVTYLGHLDHSTLRDVVARAGVAVVTPTWEEPYGLVAAEAMAAGTPVAAYARGALPEIVPAHVGALAAPDDTEDLARALERALDCDRRLVREHAEEHHSLTRMVEGYEQVYLDATRRRRSP